MSCMSTGMMNADRGQEAVKPFYSMRSSYPLDVRLPVDTKYARNTIYTATGEILLSHGCTLELGNQHGDLHAFDSDQLSDRTQ